MILVCLFVLALIAIVVMEQWWGRDVDKLLSEHVRKSVAILKT